MSGLEGKVFQVPPGVFFFARPDHSFVFVEAKPKCRTWYYASASAKPLWDAFCAAAEQEKGVGYETLKQILLDNFKFDDPAKVPEHLEKFVTRMLDFGLLEEMDREKKAPAPDAPEKKKRYVKLEILDTMPLGFTRAIPVTSIKK